MVVRLLNKVDLGVGVGGYEFSLDNHDGANSEIYDAGSKIYEALLQSSNLPAAPKDFAKSTQSASARKL